MGWEWVPGAMESLSGIEEYEVSQVMSGQKRWPRSARNRDTGLVMVTIWGRTRVGRPLMVATRKLPGLDGQIIGARALTAAEVAELEAWEATR